MSRADVLVVGSGGQLGFELMRAGWPSEWTVVGRPRAELDVTSSRAVEDAISELRPRIVVNAAAYTAVDRAESDSEQAFAVNRDGVRYLARACKTAGATLLHVSTDYVFDGEKSGPYTEDDATAPLGVYGQSKLEGEQAVREVLGEHVILRTSWVFGAHGQNFVKTMVRLAGERDVVRVVADQHGRPTAAADIAAALVRIAERPIFGTFHFGGDPPATWHDLAAEVFAGLAARGRRRPRLEAITTAEYPTPARRPANAVLACEKLRRAYSIALPSWAKSLSEVLAEL